ncbi:hypothetical protein H7X65_03945 [Candidatus Parcubacteria bacterium]|nr:hypothetical protein [Candidatus Parcubacteria bacterium]
MRNVCLCALFLVCFTISSANAQADSPVAYMNVLEEREVTLSQKYISYMSAVAHGGRARKMEKRREELVTSVAEALREANKMPPYKGDASLRDAYKEYWTVLLSVFKEEYHKIVDMEEVAEQSYDAMEAVLMIQEKAGATLNTAYAKVPIAYQAFANRQNVKLVEGEKTKLTEKLDQAGRVNKYTNQVFLIFFKSYVQETSMLGGLNAGDINTVEQSKNSMAKYAVEGLAKLDTMKSFKGDGTMITACRRVLEFQKSEADKFTTLTGFMIKQEEFVKMKKTFDSKPVNKRTQADVDLFNKSAKEYNAMANDFNKLNNDLNNARAKVLDDWNATQKKFMDVHVPYK